jgi:hypothetical protein
MIVGKPDVLLDGIHVRHPHFREVLYSLISEDQGMRIRTALATLQ